MRFSLGVLQMSSWCTCGADAVSAPLAAAGKEPLDEQAMGKKAYLSMMAQENQVPHGDAPVLPFLSSCTYTHSPTSRTGYQRHGRCRCQILRRCYDRGHRLGVLVIWKPLPSRLGVLVEASRLHADRHAIMYVKRYMHHSASASSCAC